MYVDEMREALKQLVKDPALQSLFFAMWSQEHGIIGSNSNFAQNLGSFILQDQGKKPLLRMRYPLILDFSVQMNSPCHKHIMFPRHYLQEDSVSLTINFQIHVIFVS